MEDVATQNFFREHLRNIRNTIKSNPVCLKAIDEMCTTNMVTTINLDVTDINLTELAMQFLYCHYNKSLFAALALRLVEPRCSALVYSRGTVVCMGMTSYSEALLAAKKYLQLLNRIGVLCNMTGFKVDNYVYSTYTFPLDLSRCVRTDWASVIEYDRAKFPGATCRCECMNLPFATKVTMEFFSLGKINITGAKSNEEAVYMFLLVYFKYLRHIRIFRNARSVKRELDIKHVPIFTADLQQAVTQTNEEEMRRYYQGQPHVYDEDEMKAAKLEGVDEPPAGPHMMFLTQEDLDQLEPRAMREKLKQNINALKPEQVDKLLMGMVDKLQF